MLFGTGSTLVVESIIERVRKTVYDVKGTVTTIFEV